MSLRCYTQGQKCRLAHWYNSYMLEGVSSAEEIVYESKLVRKLESLTKSRAGALVLAAISFVESSLPVPLLTDPFLAVSVLFNRTQVVRLVLVTMFSSVMGGVVAYFMATFALDMILAYVPSIMISDLDHLTEAKDSSTLALTLIGAITPVPYTVVAWAIAVLEGSLIIFIAGSVIGRGLRYAIVGYSAYRFGPLAVKYARKYIAVTSLLVFAAVALLVWLKM